MTGPDVVFLGPSLDRGTARSLLPNAVFLPPARMGDVVSALRLYRPHAIGLIDGVFQSTMSVFHKELLYAVDLGCWVLGGSSIGALRAAECDRYGVIGIGGIYERFRSGELEDDDEVALIHGDEESQFRALSDPLVTIRVSIDAALDAGVLSPLEATELVAMQKGRWFPERRMADIVHDAQAIGIASCRVEELRSWLATHSCDPKRDDAMLLLRRLGSLPSHPVPISDRPGVEMSPPFAATLARDPVVRTKTGNSVTFDEMRRFAALHDPRYPDVLASTKRKVAAEALSQWIGGELTPEEVSEGRRVVARELGVTDGELEDAARELDLDARGLELLVQREAHQKRLEMSSLGLRRLGQITEPFLDELRLNGTYSSLKELAALEQHAAGLGYVDESVGYGALLAQFVAMTSWPIPDDFAAYVQEMELGSVAELVCSIVTALRASQFLFGTSTPRSSRAEVVVEADEPLLPRGQ
jgi:hypothetical protein